MRINQYIALHTGVSRRSADKLIKSGSVEVNGQVVSSGYSVESTDKVSIKGQPVVETKIITIMFNKPAGYVCSRNGQGSKTIYDLLDEKYHNLKTVGRLDKDSSGLILLTNNGVLANSLTHPSFNKTKSYNVILNKNLDEKDVQKIEQGINLDDGKSKLGLSGKDKNWVIEISEGRNRQIRRTFEALNYTVIKLHRTNFGPYSLGNLGIGHFKQL